MLCQNLTCNNKRRKRISNNHISDDDTSVNLCIGTKEIVSFVF